LVSFSKDRFVEGRCVKALGRAKAQSGIETYTVAFIISLMFLYSFLTYVSRNAEVETSSAMMDAQKQCHEIADMINRVRANGEGFAESASFLHRARIYGSGRGVEVFFDRSSGQAGQPGSGTDYYYCTFSTSNVTNTTHTAFDVLGGYTVVNEGTDITFYKT
jgi:hypothetical protein